MADQPQLTLTELPLELLVLILNKEPQSRLGASRACRRLRHASRACEWRVRLNLLGVRNPGALLEDFVGWASGGGAPPRNVTRLTLGYLAHESTWGWLRRRTGKAQYGQLTSLRGLSGLASLASLQLRVGNPSSLAGLGLCTSLRELRVAVPLCQDSEYMSCRLLVDCWAPPSLVSLDTAEFLSALPRADRPSPARWSHLTRLTNLRVHAADVPLAVGALPSLQHLHVSWPRAAAAPFYAELCSLCQVSTCLTRLVVEGCFFRAAYDTPGSCLKELELLDCNPVPAAISPSAALSRLCLTTSRSGCTSVEDLAVLVSNVSRTLVALELTGRMHSDIFLEYGLQCPQLRTLRLAFLKGRYIRPGCFHGCFEGLPALQDLVIEVPEDRSERLGADELADVAARGCRTELVFVEDPHAESDGWESWGSDDRPEDEAWLEDEADGWAAHVLDTGRGYDALHGDF